MTFEGGQPQGPAGSIVCLMWGVRPSETTGDGQSVGVVGAGGWGGVEVGGHASLEGPTPAQMAAAPHQVSSPVTRLGCA